MIPFDYDLFFTCSLIEYIGRLTKNERHVVVNQLGFEGIDYIYEYADVLHCENIDAVSDEIITHYNVVNGDYDNIKECENVGYLVPTFWDIGKVYTYLFGIIFREDNIVTRKDKVEFIIEFYNTRTSYLINDYTASVYFIQPELLYNMYKEVEELDRQTE